MKKETIAIQRPQGADLQPLIFRIPEVVLELFRCYLQGACRVGGGVERGQAGAGQSLHSELFGQRLMREEAIDVKRPHLPGADRAPVMNPHLRLVFSIR